jgi:hypothetical protein
MLRVDTPIRCNKCKKIIIYIPKGYCLNIPVVCINCHNGITPQASKIKKSKRTASENYSKVIKGVRPDIHPTYSFRSLTEINFARLLNYLKLDWQYENKLFKFDGYKRKPYAYLMDFEITTKNKILPAGYYEIKGWMNGQSRQKLKRLKKCFPEDAKKTTVVIYSHYNKKDIAFCESLGYKYLFYDLLYTNYEKVVQFESKKKQKP